MKSTSPVRVDPERAEPATLAGFHAQIGAECLERLAMLGRHRAERPRRDVAILEERARAQLDALALVGAGGVDESPASNNPWLAWATAVSLASRGALTGEHVGALAGVAGGSGARRVAEAIRLFPVVRDRWLSELGSSSDPLARAVWIDLAVGAGELSSDATMALLDGPPPVACAALVALDRAPTGVVAPPRVEAFLRHPDDRVAHEALRVLTLADPEMARAAVRTDAKLRMRAGGLALEALIACGKLEDIELFEQTLRALPASAHLLDAVARFGHPESWAYLVHYLPDLDLGADAARALVTLFGPIVAPEATSGASAWRDALAEAELDPAVRLRAGRPWTLATIVDECADPARSRGQIRSRLDELAARTGLVAEVNIAQWAPEVERALGRLPARYAGARLRRLA